MVTFVDSGLMFVVFPIIVASLGRRSFGSRTLWFIGSIAAAFLAHGITTMIFTNESNVELILRYGVLNPYYLAATCLSGITIAVLSAATGRAKEPSIVEHEPQCAPVPPNELDLGNNVPWVIAGVGGLFLVLILISSLNMSHRAERDKVGPHPIKAANK